jgi:hypothetical protein
MRAHSWPNKFFVLLRVRFPTRRMRALERSAARPRHARRQDCAIHAFF